MPSHVDFEKLFTDAGISQEEGVRSAAQVVGLLEAIHNGDSTEAALSVARLDSADLERCIAAVALLFGAAYLDLCNTPIDTTEPAQD